MAEPSLIPEDYWLDNSDQDDDREERDECPFLLDCYEAGRKSCHGCRFEKKIRRG